MAGKYFEELEVGTTFVHQPSRTVTETDNLLFTTLTHNTQPLHLDAEFAARQQYGQILVNSLYTLALVGITVMFALTPAVGLAYLGAVLALGAVFIWMAWKLKRDYSRAGAKKVYLYSLLYLTLVFAAVMGDSLSPW